MFCPYCGTQLSDGSASCTSCGKSLQSRVKVSGNHPSSVPQPTSAQPQPSQQPTPIYQPSQQPVYPQQQAPYQYPYQNQPYPVAPTKPAKPPKAPKPKKERKPLPRPSGGTKALTVILCIFMALCLVFATFIGMIRGLVNEDTLYAVLDEVEFSELTFSTTDGDEQSLADAINTSVVNNTPEFVYDAGDAVGIIELDDDDIEDIFSTDEVRDFIVDTILGYTDHFFYGKRLKPISAEDIADFVLENDWLIFEETGKVVSFAEKEIMISEMNKYFDFEAIESDKSMEKSIGFSLSPLTFVFSTLYYILYAVAAICFILVIVFNRKNLPACMTKVGVTSIVFSVWMLLLGVGMLIGGNFIGNLPFATILTAIFSQITSYFLIWGGAAFVFGLVLILVRKYFLKPRFE